MNFATEQILLVLPERVPPHRVELGDLKRKWIDEAALKVAELAEAGKLPEPDWSSDDLHTLLTKQPEQLNWWGCLIAKLRNQRMIKRTGSKPSTRDTRNGAWIGTYKWQQVAPAGHLVLTTDSHR